MECVGVFKCGFYDPVDELPPPEETPEYQIYEINGISVYESPSDLEAISYNRLYLDLSGVPGRGPFLHSFIYNVCFRA